MVSLYLVCFILCYIARTEAWYYCSIQSHFLFLIDVFLKKISTVLILRLEFSITCSRKISVNIIFYYLVLWFNPQFEPIFSCCSRSNWYFDGFRNNLLNFLYLFITCSCKKSVKVDFYKMNSTLKSGHVPFSTFWKAKKLSWNELVNFRFDLQNQEVN